MPAGYGPCAEAVQLVTHFWLGWANAAAANRSKGRIRISATRIRWKATCKVSDMAKKPHKDQARADSKAKPAKGQAPGQNEHDPKGRQGQYGGAGDSPIKQP